MSDTVRPASHQQTRVCALSSTCALARAWCRACQTPKGRPMKFGFFTMPEHPPNENWTLSYDRDIA
ncbi:MAG: hypothetical protein OJJ54_01910, partial [Pseudonocardia sp.]|nr:hypothetical protein [Pseudonocardia sp.]